MKLENGIFVTRPDHIHGVFSVSPNLASARSHDVEEKYKCIPFTTYDVVESFP